MSLFIEIRRRRPFFLSAFLSRRVGRRTGTTWIRTEKLEPRLRGDCSSDGVGRYSEVRDDGTLESHDRKDRTTARVALEMVGRKVVRQLANRSNLPRP